MFISRLIAVTLLATLAACAREPSADEAQAAARNEWVIESKVVFLEADRKTPRAAPPVSTVRLWMPFVVGDMYGAPNAGELAPVELKPDYTFTLDLNKVHTRLRKSLQPTAFSQVWMVIEPAQARIARLSPFVLQADGIAPVGSPDWIDTATGRRLMLLYVDRPSRIRGEINYQGRNLRFDIQAPAEGYLWMEQPDESGDFRAVSRPANLVLGVLPD